MHGAITFEQPYKFLSANVQTGESRVQILEQQRNKLGCYHSIRRQPSGLFKQTADPVALGSDSDLTVCIDHSLQERRTRPRTSDDEDVRIHGRTGPETNCLLVRQLHKFIERLNTRD